MKYGKNKCKPEDNLVDEFNNNTVSYTHLDVYKRQIFSKD